MTKVLDTLLLLALPASGKSEVRRYIKELSPREAARDFHMGETVQLDDFPYVHLMRRIDDELVKLAQARVFFMAPDRSFRDGRDWGTLIELLNEDHSDLVHGRSEEPSSAAASLLARIERASEKVGIGLRLANLDDAIGVALVRALEREAQDLWVEKRENLRAGLEGKTLVVEFARGGKAGASMPLPDPFGYAYSLARLSPALLERSSILYVWVTPEESLRKNTARTDPNDPGSILHHGVPIEVMLNDYGSDDMDWLERSAERRGTVTVRAHGRTFHIPIGRFDNRVDKTSFLRAPKSEWKVDEVRTVHEGLRSALAKLALQ